jgi:hypothetical protein
MFSVQSNLSLPDLFRQSMVLQANAILLNSTRTTMDCRNKCGNDNLF